MASPKELSAFLKDVEKRAYKRAFYHMRNNESALDIVQDSMMRLAESYGDRPANELPMLFQRILSNATLDWFRRQKVQIAHFASFSDFESDTDDGDFDFLESLSTAETAVAFENPETRNMRVETLQMIEAELVQLPGRQREATSCVTGRIWMLPKLLPPWDVHKGVSRHIVPEPFTVC